jgi:polyferredoxin
LPTSPAPTSSKRAKPRGNCVHPSLSSGASISLPVIQGQPSADKHATAIRPSKSGKRRAIILGTVQALLILHVMSWAFGWFGDRTLTPIEPSESMEFSRQGIVNAGLIFFSLALLSTLILGRWFCGWGCHIVLLQDLCGWMMKKMGVRPKPFRSRLLIYVPLLLALYMFIWPALYRVAVAPALTWASTKWPTIMHPAPVVPWGLHVELTTAEFWRTFPGVMVAIPFLFVCGFAIVYFLGAKGFCTYGCPYGGFFAPLDKFAPGRIRVTDACEGCGHCTAVCTSNVRVHEEVREYGMVVDPGCMKCLDCVSVCPNEALYFGFGAPAVAKGEAKNQAPARKHDLTLKEEALCAIVFAITFFSTRGIYGVVPMLMAAGLAGCMTFIVWKAWRLWRDDNVTLHRFQLKLRGRMQRAGVVFMTLTLLAAAFVLHSGAVNAANKAAAWHDDRVEIMPEDVFIGRAQNVSAAIRSHAQAALRWYTVASSMRFGGIALSAAPQGQGTIDIRRAWLLSVLGRFDEAEALLRAAHARQPTQMTAAGLARVLRDAPDQSKRQEAAALYQRTLLEHPMYDQLLADYEPWALAVGLADKVVAVHSARLEAQPDNLQSLRSMTIILMQSGHLEDGLAFARRWIERAPDSSEAYRMQSLGLADSGKMDLAIGSMRKAADLAPNDPFPRSLLADLLQAIGMTAEAQVERAKAQEIAAGLQQSHGHQLP